jgi:hypothetical protein
LAHPEIHDPEHEIFRGAIVVDGLERLGERTSRRALPLTFAETTTRLDGAGRGYLERLDEAISTDLNTAQALAVLTQVSRDPEVGPVRWTWPMSARGSIASAMPALYGLITRR